jgi:predicted esterase
MRWVGLLGLALACQGSRSASPAAQERSPPVIATTRSPAPVEPAPEATPRSEPAQLPVAPRSPWPPPAPGVTSDFCIEAMTALDEETCYVLPEATTDELLLYLHGTIPPGRTSPQKTNLGTVLSNAAKRGKFAALLPRGRRGLAPATQKDWWGWPTSGTQYQRWASEMVSGFAAKRAKLEALIGAPFARFYVAGSSSGAYFAAALALSGELGADGYAAISGGAWLERNRIGELAPKPFYVGYGQHDTVAASAQRLGERLRVAGWPVLVAVHPVPHGAREIYLDEALAHFRQGLP